MKKTTLVIMAAGIGSRFGGGIKQLEPVGPNGEIIMDYAIYDALAAGFNDIVFIIRKDLEEDFKEVIGDRISQIAPVSYAYQEVTDLPAGFKVPIGRTKPWGTGQAVLSIKGIVHNPFLVINADDYYGKEGFKKIHQYMIDTMNEDGDVYDICMGGFILSNTLSDHGGVTRGVCTVDADGVLENVTETYNIEFKNGQLTAYTEQGEPVSIKSDQQVSMNMWGLPAAFIDELEVSFPNFLEQLNEHELKGEFLLPQIIDDLVKAGKARVTVLKTPDKWFGVTYQQDKEIVIEAIRALIHSGVYPQKLF